MNNSTISEKRIAVVGAGGVGGYLGAMLAKTFPHVSLAVRGDRLTSIREHGLILHSDHSGEITARPERAVSTAELGPQDFIFICVKNYSLEQVCRELSGSVSDHTVIIPVMNGVDPAQRIRSLLDAGTVVEALIYIVAFANHDFSITQQGDFANLRIGMEHPTAAESACIREVADILSLAGIDHKIASDIRLEIWRKYILNCAYNVATACYDNTIGQLRRDPQKAGEYEALVWEAYHVGCAEGVRLKEDHAASIIRKFYNELAEDATSSLQRDVRAGKPAEVDTFSGYIVREAERLGIDAPVSKRMYDMLKKKGY